MADSQLMKVLIHLLSVMLLLSVCPFTSAQEESAYTENKLEQREVKKKKSKNK